MGKVISTLTYTTYIRKILPQNCPKTTSELPQIFCICSDPPPLLAVLRQKKGASKLLVCPRPLPFEKKNLIFEPHFLGGCLP